MKKLFVYGLSIALIAGAASCKKTSKGKMANEWTVTSYSYNSTSSSSTAGSISTKETTTGTETSETTVTTTGSSSETKVKNITENLYTINKDGSWTSSSNMNWIEIDTLINGGGMLVISTDNISSETTISGQWDFLGGVGEFKKNERVTFNATNWNEKRSVANSTTTTINGVTSTSTGNSSTNSTETFTDGQVSEIYTIVESKKKELQLSADGTQVSSSSSVDNGGTTTTNPSNTYTLTSSMTLTQK